MDFFMVRLLCGWEDQLIFIRKEIFGRAEKKGSKGKSESLEPSHWILPGTYFHTQLQKVRGWVGRFFMYEG